MKSYITQKPDGHKINFHFTQNDKYLGFAYMEVDGDYVFVFDANGTWSGYVLMAIGQSLKELNQSSKKKNKPFIVANVRELTDKYNDEEISFPRMVEMLNKIAAEYYKSGHL